MRDEMVCLPSEILWDFFCGVNLVQADDISDCNV